jgi:hypothetical protein
MAVLCMHVRRLIDKTRDGFLGTDIYLFFGWAYFLVELNCVDKLHFASFQVVAIDQECTYIAQCQRIE